MFLLDKGVISSGSKYGANDKVTREEVAVMVSKAVGLDGTQTATKFPDVPASPAELLVSDPWWHFLSTVAFTSYFDLIKQFLLVSNLINSRGVTKFLCFCYFGIHISQQ